MSDPKLPVSSRSTPDSLPQSHLADAPTMTGIGSRPTREVGPTAEGAALRPEPAAAPAASLLAPGQGFGAFTIVRLLGQGGMGEVYEAEEADSGRRVALKLLNRPLGTADERERFLREGRLAASISHSHCVYVLGTGEVQGLPVISMELAAGGTLKDVVKTRGPLPPREAVDAILQVVAGLEAAAAAGVLHRDIKPANCFVDRDGTVKVGDFGLSTSTLARDETHLTMAGTIMGTPAFASPEQLRSEDLDVRSDIYSVGATLYYLLTGLAPFDEANIVRLVTMVVQQVPPSPRAARREIPKELSAVVLRALAKKPADRFADYAALRAALEPFGSAAPIPAQPGLRIVACVLDLLVLAVLAALFFSPLALVRTRLTVDLTAQLAAGLSVERLVLGFFFNCLYWLLLEGLSGASLGKRVFGLRVTGVNGEPAGLRRVLVRTLVFVGLSFVLQVVLLQAVAVTASRLATLVISAGPLLVLFSTARRRNGWAGLHELAGATRVIARRDRELAPVWVASAARPVVRGSTRTGPYLLADEPAASPGPSVVAAWDEQLRRPVWLHFVATAVALPAWRRDLARSARLRWLAGRRSESAAWDAYEAVEGQSFLETVATPQPWRSVRGWLRDLSGEIETGLQDGSLPALGLDRLWVGTDGRIRLLDWPAPGVALGSDASTPPDAAPVDLASAERFLDLVARTSLAGQATVLAERGDRPAALVPLAASQFLEDLEGARFTSAPEMAAHASAIVRGPTAVSRGRRALHLALAGLPPLFTAFALWLLVFVLVPFVTSGKADLFNYVFSLSRLQLLDTAPDTAETRAIREAREIDIAARFPQFLHAPPESSPVERGLRPEVQALIRRIRANHPNPSTEEVRRAREILAPLVAKERAEAQRTETAMVRSVRQIWPELLLIAWAAFAAVGFLLALVVRGGLMLRLLGIAAVDRTGREVRRSRSALRALAAWFAIVAAMIARASVGPQYGSWVAAPLVLLFLGGAVYAIVRPERGLQDRLAGTWLVPR